jgi:hypothetical protein
VFAGKEGLGREGWSGRKGETGGREAGEGSRRGAVGCGEDEGRVGGDEKEKKPRRKLIKLYRKINR